MISDEERREIARELREVVGARCYGRPGVTGSCVDIDDFLTALLDRRVRDCEVSIDSTEALRVADLIEPEPERTCGIDMPVIDCETGETDYRCSSCGFSADPQDWAETYVYCPRCGAKVVG